MLSRRPFGRSSASISCSCGMFVGLKTLLRRCSSRAAATSSRERTGAVATTGTTATEGAAPSAAPVVGAAVGSALGVGAAADTRSAAPVVGAVVGSALSVGAAADTRSAAPVVDAAAGSALSVGAADDVGAVLAAALHAMSTVGAAGLSTAESSFLDENGRGSRDSRELDVDVFFSSAAGAASVDGGGVGLGRSNGWDTVSRALLLQVLGRAVGGGDAGVGVGGAGASGGDDDDGVIFGFDVKKTVLRGAGGGGWLFRRIVHKKNGAHNKECWRSSYTNLGYGYWLWLWLYSRP